MNLYELGCSDGGCIIRKPIGMHTNGGCGCAKMLMQELGVEQGRRITTALRERQRQVDALKALVESVAEQQAMPDDSWKAEITKIDPPPSQLHSEEKP